MIGVVGGSGLIARPLWQTFAGLPDTELRVFARTMPSGLPDPESFFPLDLASPAPLPPELGSCDLVVNASSRITGDAAAMQRVNVDGVRRIADAVEAGRGALVQISTGGVYGTLRRCGGLEGDSEIRPESDLSRTRAEGDRIAAGVGASLLRPLFVTGVGDTHFLLPLLRAHLALGGWIEGGGARLSVVSATELADTAVSIVDQVLAGSAPPLLHVVPETPITVRELLSPILAQLGRAFSTSLSVSEAVDLLRPHGVSRRKIEQFAQDYFLGSSAPRRSEDHPVAPDVAAWYLSQLR